MRSTVRDAAINRSLAMAEESDVLYIGCLRTNKFSWPENKRCIAYRHAAMVDWAPPCNVRAFEPIAYKDSTES
jgi:hypothetical protein